MIDSEWLETARLTPGRVLVECGYLNSSADRARLLNAEYRRKLAEGIVAGLRAYVEGTPIK